MLVNRTAVSADSYCILAVFFCPVVLQRLCFGSFFDLFGGVMVLQRQLDSFVCPLLARQFVIQLPFFTIYVFVPLPFPPEKKHAKPAIMQKQHYPSLVLSADGPPLWQ